MMPSLSLQMSSSAEAKGSYEGSQDLAFKGGAASGNRGFVNNFAGGGSSLSPPDINGGVISPGILAWALPLAALALIVGLIIWRKHHS